MIIDTNVTSDFKVASEDTMSIEEAKNAVFATRAKQREERYFNGSDSSAVFEICRADGVQKDYLKFQKGM